MFKPALTTLIVLAAAQLVGCAEPILRPDFPEAEYKKLEKPGTGSATITGQAFLRTRGGDVKYGAGSNVMLNPLTSYSAVWYQALMQQRPLKPAESDPRLNAYIATTTADGSGKFTFKKVPEGCYFATAKVTWEVPFCSGGVCVPSEQGGFIARKVCAKPGETEEIIITQ